MTSPRQNTFGDGQLEIQDGPIGNLGITMSHKGVTEKWNPKRKDKRLAKRQPVKSERQN